MEEPMDFNSQYDIAATAAFIHNRGYSRVALQSDLKMPRWFAASYRVSAATSILMAVSRDCHGVKCLPTEPLTFYVDASVFGIRPFVKQTNKIKSRAFGNYPHGNLGIAITQFEMEMKLVPYPICVGRRTEVS
eukprot:Gb_13964 [translate_table: standard]